MSPMRPTGMIFVLSRAGRSHCEEEFTPMNDSSTAPTRFSSLAGGAGEGRAG